MGKTVFGSIIAVAATIFLSVGAAAGASVQHISLNMPQQCFPGKFGSTYCLSSTGEENIVETPSGNFSAQIHVSSAFLVTDSTGTVLASGTDSLHEHVLYASNFAVLKEGTMHETSTVTSGGMTCTFSADVHVTNLDLATGTGHIQYDRVSFVCV